MIQVTRNLKALAKYPMLRPDEIAQSAQLAEETRSNSNALYRRAAGPEVGEGSYGALSSALL
jgi:hypothetical protein